MVRLHIPKQGKICNTYVQGCTEELNRAHDGGRGGGGELGPGKDTGKSASNSSRVAQPCRLAYNMGGNHLGAVDLRRQ